jgi:arsenate reductase
MAPSEADAVGPTSSHDAGRAQPPEYHRRGRPPLRVLFLCTANSARSQIAEALLNRKARGRFEAGSAGVEPAPELNPLTIEVLTEHGIDPAGLRPKGLDAVRHEQWDFVITVCDRAKENCPTFPGRPIYTDWAIEDPTAPVDVEWRRAAFRTVFHYLNRRVDLLLALPMERLERRAQEERVRALSADTATAAPRINEPGVDPPSGT